MQVGNHCRFAADVPQPGGQQVVGKVGRLAVGEDLPPRTPRSFRAHISHNLRYLSFDTLWGKAGAKDRVARRTVGDEPHCFVILLHHDAWQAGETRKVGAEVGLDGLGHRFIVGKCCDDLAQSSSPADTR
ncbi:MAG: hypothetical protein DLM69_07530 [Candidatus Chloroheliales bacterium]|nr:MAG: hypothetical protein DLM69_07530 [Chloroflexota bacterium]